MFTKPLAMVIEDNPDQNLVFTTALEKAGFATESYQDGATAILRLGKVVPALVVLDLHLPGVNGGLLLRSIRSDPLTAKTHVIIVSADAEFASQLETRVDLVMIKPVSFSQLSQAASRFNPGPGN